MFTPSITHALGCMSPISPELSSSRSEAERTPSRSGCGSHFRRPETSSVASNTAAPPAAAVTTRSCLPVTSMPVSVTRPGASTQRVAWSFSGAPPSGPGTSDGWARATHSATVATCSGYGDAGGAGPTPTHRTKHAASVGAGFSAASQLPGLSRQSFRHTTLVRRVPAPHPSAAAVRQLAAAPPSSSTAHPVRGARWAAARPAAAPRTPITTSSRPALRAQAGLRPTRMRPPPMRWSDPSPASRTLDVPSWHIHMYIHMYQGGRLY